MKSPFILITGFLGSGKTTLLKRMLSSTDSALKIAVIQNEFADIGVDARELDDIKRPFKILEINRGSAFCVCLLSDFIQSCSALVAEYHPDIMILEATGLADPIAVAQLISNPPLGDVLYLSQCWAVVDASTFIAMQSAITRVRHQIRVADVVIINKTDLASPADICAVEAKILELNPYAKVIQSAYCQITIDDVAASNGQPVAIRRQNEDATAQAGGRPGIASAALRSTRRISRDNLSQFLRAFESTVYRIKGFVNLTDKTTVAIQSCFGKTSILSAEKYLGPTELVALGPGIDSASFISSFEKLTE